jgi:hypothetical protein
MPPIPDAAIEAIRRAEQIRGARLAAAAGYITPR